MKTTLPDRKTNHYLLPSFFLSLCWGLAAAPPAFAEVSIEKRFYGVIEGAEQDKFKSVQNLDPFRRRTIDMKEIEAELEIYLGPQSKFEFEVEIEHGGTGTALEFDAFEEFGEFESEIERGGEVSLSEAYYEYSLGQEWDLVVGKAPLRLSLSSNHESPLEYAATTPSSLEGRMLPTDWTEPGLFIQYAPRWFSQDWKFRVGQVAGLNSEFFRKYSWIGGGHQRQFEGTNLDDVATTVNLQWGDFEDNTAVALGYYQGNSKNNRHKKDKLNVDARVTLWTAMASYRWNGLGVLAQALRGDLENSEAVATANATLGGLAKPKNFAALGAKAQADLVQLSYEFPQNWTLFVQQEKANTFAAIQGEIYADPRYDVQQWSYGLAHHWDNNSYLKAQFIKEKTQLEGLPETQKLIVQLGFDTGEF